jgi:hypothetical protein
MMVKTAEAIKEKTISFFREKLSARNAKRKVPKPSRLWRKKQAGNCRQPFCENVPQPLVITAEKDKAAQIPKVPIKIYTV